MMALSGRSASKGEDPCVDAEGILFRSFFDDNWLVTRGYSIRSTHRVPNSILIYLLATERVLLDSNCGTVLLNVCTMTTEQNESIIGRITLESLPSGE